MDCIVPGVTKSLTWLRNFLSFFYCVLGNSVSTFYVLIHKILLTTLELGAIIFFLGAIIISISTEKEISLAAKQKY